MISIFFKTRRYSYYNIISISVIPDNCCSFIQLYSSTVLSVTSTFIGNIIRIIYHCDTRRGRFDKGTNNIGGLDAVKQRKGLCARLADVYECIIMHRTTLACARERNIGHVHMVHVLLSYIPVRIPELKVIVPSRMVSIGDGVQRVKKSLALYDTIRKRSPTPIVLHTLQVSIKVVCRICIHIFFFTRPLQPYIISL